MMILDNIDRARKLRNDLDAAAAVLHQQSVEYHRTLSHIRGIQAELKSIGVDVPEGDCHD